jgi:geranylgeranyl reductase family protein
MTPRYDVAIIGAGPAGCSTALSLKESGLEVALIDKSTFPRDKICGDALSPDVVNQLRMLPLDTGELFMQLEEKIVCQAVRLVAPNYNIADVQLSTTELSGYLTTRFVFDNYMFEQAEKVEEVTTMCGKGVKTITKTGETHEILFDDGTTIEAKMLVGADGAHSVVAKQMAHQKLDKEHHCAGLRVYYENVTGFSDGNAIELHFYEDFLPGYFWMFPLPDNKANIGVGMLSSFVSSKKVNLKKKLEEIISTHPNVAHRFKDAKPLETIKGFGLPLGSQKISLSGEGYLLTGDAASLINPLSGEGIGNAIRSGRVAGGHLKKVFEEKNFDADFHKAYDNEIYHRMWGELKTNYFLQRALRNPRFSNFFIKRALGNPSLQALILSGFDTNTITKSFTSRKFLRDLFFGAPKDNKSLSS